VNNNDTLNNNVKNTKINNNNVNTTTNNNNNSVNTTTISSTNNSVNTTTINSTNNSVNTTTINSTNNNVNTTKINSTDNSVCERNIQSSKTDDKKVFIKDENNTTIMKQQSMDQPNNYPDDNHQNVESKVTDNTIVNQQSLVQLTNGTHNQTQDTVVLAAGTTELPRTSARLQARNQLQPQIVPTNAPLQQTAVRTSARLQARATATANNQENLAVAKPPSTEAISSMPINTESLKLLEIINAIPSPKLPESTRNLLTGSGEWSNRDLDEAFTQLNLNRMPARFLVDMQDHPSTTLATLKTKMKDTLYLPLWIRHHWILGVWTPGMLTIADSSPGIATKADFLAVQALLAYASLMPVGIQWFNVPRQPSNSVECGLHVAINLILAVNKMLKAHANKPNQRVIEYERTLGPLITKWLANNIPLPQLLTSTLTHIAEVGIELLSQKEVLEMCDKVSDNAPLEVIWVEQTEKGNILQTWTGNLTKRRGNAWTVVYKERDGIFSIPSPNVNYLAVKSAFDELLYEDVMAKNVAVPTNAATVVGDSMTVAQLKDYLSLEEREFSQLFKTATAPSTRKNHTAMLKLLGALPNAYNPIGLTTSILISIQERANQRDWKASTMVSKLASIQGALRLLPFYRKDAPSILMSSTIWRMALRGASYAANAEIPDQAPIMTQPQMNVLIKHHADTTPSAIPALVELAWLVAGRVGDVAQLAPHDVTFNEKEVLMVRFRRGKTARRGQYSIATTHPSPQTAAYIHKMQEEGGLWLFPGLTKPKVSKMVKDHLRLHVSIHKIECRSLRRGRLQLLSARGMNDDELLHISRHQTLSSLRRYLNFGTKSGENMRRVKRVQEVLESSSDETSSQSSSSSTLTQ